MDTIHGCNPFMIFRIWIRSTIFFLLPYGPLGLWSSILFLWILLLLRTCLWVHLPLSPLLSGVFYGYIATSNVLFFELFIAMSNVFHLTIMSNYYLMYLGSGCTPSTQNKWSFFWPFKLSYGTAMRSWISCQYACMTCIMGMSLVMARPCFCTHLVLVC